MPAIHGKNTGICIGVYDITRWCNEVTGDRKIDVAETTGFDAPGGAKEYTVGLNDQTFKWSGRDSGTVDSLRNRIGGLAAVELASPFTVAIEGGWIPGRIAELGSVLETSINLSAPVADVVSASGDLQADGVAELGKVLTAKGDYSTTGTVNGGAVDLGAAAAGARIHYHLVSNARNGSVTLKVQHSVDASTWVDYDTFTIPAGQVDALARTLATSLNRYARIVVTLAGSSGAVSARVAIARRS